MTPTATPTNRAAPVAGSCRATDGSSPGLATIYTAYTTDSSTPVTITYSAFDRDGKIETHTETVTGPVVSRLSYPCTDAASGDPSWVFTVTAPNNNVGVGCSIALGNDIYKTDSPADSGRTTVDCGGNPGYE